MAVSATWLGGPGEPESCEWMGVTFPKGEAVEITNEFQIRKAKGNPFFAVDDSDGDKQEAQPAKPTKADHLAKARAAKALKNAPIQDVDA